MHPYKKETEGQRNERKMAYEGKTDPGRRYVTKLKDGKRDMSQKVQP